MNIVLVLCFWALQAAQADVTLQTVYKFYPSANVGRWPFGQMADGDGGSFYGTTSGYYYSDADADYGRIWLSSIFPRT